MAPEVIDLISSSPPPLRRPLATASDNGTLNKRPIVTQSKQRSVSPSLFVSENFDIDDSFLERGTRRSKRARLSTSPSSPRAATARQPLLLKPTTSKRRNRVIEFDPIEFTSSIEQEASESRLGNGRIVETSTRAAKCTKPPPQPILLDSDPFESSPLPAVPIAITDSEKRPSRATNIDNLSDPFASSPLPPQPPPRPSRLPGPSPAAQTLEFSDPFASSPEPVAEKVSSERRAISVDAPAQRPRRLDDWDPISSSLPDPTPRNRKTPTAALQAVGPTVIHIDSDSQNESDDEFPHIADFDVSKFQPRTRSLRRAHSDIVSSRSGRPQSATSKLTTEQKARDRDIRAAAKSSEKEKRRIEREQIKEAKAREKERAAALTEVNKIRTDKKVSTPEMILVIPSSIDEGLKVQVGTMLDGLNVQHVSWESPAGNAFKWRRKVTSRFDEEMGRWEPVPLRIMPEAHVLILVNAAEFVDLAVHDTLDSAIHQTKAHFPGHEVLYLLEGINAWMRKNRNIRNRQFVSGVRSQQPTSESTATGARGGRRRNNAAAQAYISEDVIEDALLRLQVEHEVLIHHTAAPLETAQWIVHFTQHISTIPYKKQRDKATAVAGFCMESGQVRTGDDTRDTYVRMLQEIARVTAPIAYGIMGEFGSVSKLVDGLEEGGPLRLESVRKSANKDGALSDRVVGQAVSRRIYKVFTGRDELSTDV